MKDSVQLHRPVINRTAIFVAAIILLQCVMLVLVGNQKDGYHIDENYSYILSNSYDADKMINADWMWGNWVGEDDFNEFVTVQNKERFSFGSVYKNNSTDCHPPLYYWSLHAICSIFPNSFNKWFGLVINLICFVVTACFLWLISKELITSEKLRILPLALYGFSLFAIDTGIFIRMYMMLTMFTVIFAYIQIKIIKEGVTARILIHNGLILYFGAMTQYYFVVFAFLAVLVLSVYLLLKKKIKSVLAYCGTSLLAVLLMVISYPFVFSQATGSSTNNVGTEISKNLLNFKLWFKQMFSLAYSSFCRLSFYYKVSFLLVLAAFGLAVFLLIFRKATKAETRLPYKSCFVWLAAVLVTFFLAITFIGGDFVYERYLYNVMPLFYLLLIMLFDCLMKSYSKLQLCTMIFGLVFAVANCFMLYRNDKCAYLFEKSDNTQQLSQYEAGNLLVFVKERGSAIPTGNYWDFRAFDEVYMDTAEGIAESGIFEQCLEDGDDFIVYIAEPGYWVDGFDPDELLGTYNTERDFEYEQISEARFGSYYHIDPAE